MDLTGAAAHVLRSSWLAAVRRWNRLDVTVETPIPDRPCLVVANHGFGGIVDLNVAATLTALDDATDRPIRALTHQIAWTLGVGGIIETLGAVPASRDAALTALAAGLHVLVFPGGDLDAAKPFDHRNDIDFHHRHGFARLAIEAAVPIVPIVTAGAGESLLVLTDGAGLAKRLGLHRWLRADAMPVSVSIPWGVNVGLVGLLPYLPLPTKLDTRILTAIHPGHDETAEELAARVHDVMQAALDDLTDGRVPLLGRPQPTPPRDATAGQRERAEQATVEDRHPRLE